jgi:hypothetical protein
LTAGIGEKAVVLGAEFDPRYVADADKGAVGLGTDDDASELLGIGETALGAQAVLVLLVGIGGQLADYTRRA